jgi:hypothetical protein
MARRKSKKVAPKKKGGAGGKKTVCTTTNLRCQVAKKGKATTMKSKLAKEAPLDIEVDMDAAYDMKHRSRPRLENWNFSNMALRGLTGDNMTKITSKTRKIRVPGGGVRYITEYMGDVDDKKKPEEIASEAAGDLDIGELNRQALRASAIRRGRRGVAQPGFRGAGGFDLNNNGGDSDAYMSAASSHASARDSMMGGSNGSGGSEMSLDRGDANNGARGHEQWQMDYAQRGRSSPEMPDDEVKDDRDRDEEVEEKSEHSSRQLEDKSGQVPIATPERPASSFEDNVMTLQERRSFAFTLPVRLDANTDESSLGVNKAGPKDDGAGGDRSKSANRRRLELHEAQGFGAGAPGDGTDDEEPVVPGLNIAYLKSLVGYGSAQKKRVDKAESVGDIEEGLRRDVEEDKSDGDLAAYANQREEEYKREHDARSVYRKAKDARIAKEARLTKFRSSKEYKDLIAEGNDDEDLVAVSENIYNAIERGDPLVMDVYRKAKAAEKSDRRVALAPLQSQKVLQVENHKASVVPATPESAKHRRLLTEGVQHVQMLRRNASPRVDAPSFSLGVGLGIDAFTHVEEGARSAVIAVPELAAGVSGPGPGSVAAALFGAPLAVVNMDGGAVVGRPSLKEARRAEDAEFRRLHALQVEAALQADEHRKEDNAIFKAQYGVPRRRNNPKGKKK